jgi:hypothetical protein
MMTVTPLGTTRIANDRMMLGDVIEEYSRSLGDPLQVDHLVHFNRWLEREFGQPAPLSALTPALIRAWLAGFVEDRQYAAQVLWAFQVYALGPQYGRGSA